MSGAISRTLVAALIQFQKRTAQQCSTCCRGTTTSGIREGKILACRGSAGPLIGEASVAYAPESKSCADLEMRRQARAGSGLQCWSDHVGCRSRRCETYPGCALDASTRETNLQVLMPELIACCLAAFRGRHRCLADWGSEACDVEAGGREAAEWKAGSVVPEHETTLLSCFIQASRVRFRCRDLLRLKLRRKYDVVLLLSTSKRVHLQQLGGSIGLNMTSAKSPLKAFWCLAAGMETRALSNSSGAASDGSVREVS